MSHLLSFDPSPLPPSLPISSLHLPRLLAVVMEARLTLEIQRLPSRHHQSVQHDRPIPLLFRTLHFSALTSTESHQIILRHFLTSSLLSTSNQRRVPRSDTTSPQHSNEPCPPTHTTTHLRPRLPSTQDGSRDCFCWRQRRQPLHLQRG